MFLKKSAIVGAVLAAGLVLGAPLASATTYPSTGGSGHDGGSSTVDNRGCNAGDGIGNISCNPIGVDVQGPLVSL
jgi:hypothetical protein